MKLYVPQTDEEKQLINDYRLKFGDKGLRKIIKDVTGLYETFNKDGIPDGKVDMRFEELLSVAWNAVSEASVKYQSDKGTEFSSFVEVVAKKRLTTKVYRDDKRLLRMIDNNHDSLDRTIDDGNSSTLGDTLIGDENVEYECFNRNVQEYLNRLPDDARRILKLRLKGYEYSEMSKRLGISERRVKNMINAYIKAPRNLEILRRKEEG